MVLLTKFPRFCPHRWVHSSTLPANSISTASTLVTFVAFLSRYSSKTDYPNTRYFSKMPAADSSSLLLKFTKVNPDAFPPTKGSVKAAGYDLKSAEDVTVPSRGKALVDTGIKIELPHGCYGRIAPRSGLAVKNFIDVGAGVVDEDYRGVLKVVLFNHSDADFEVKRGDRIAQLICEKIYYPDLIEVEELSDTTRGEGGFGSTGTN
ncbi:probable deoxyuridine 5'-triphosphate nucleotidohydrolase [Sitophilus oryzae]|uniref:Deoxyuridine 5'-triphosphate nucleotidohydrolase n=1 Tax=Sitophilus oryzae TaxID=7048 RepID=A0A6J2YLN7_SITOR|nr:probable deoxyuridine 5'-triphosphate nucleotidohydrolase [Sitophilus oryzae]